MGMTILAGLLGNGSARGYECKQFLLFVRWPLEPTASTDTEDGIRKKSIVFVDTRRNEYIEIN